MGVAQSTVVACHGLSLSTFSPLRMLQKKLLINGICASAYPQTACETLLFNDMINSLRAPSASGFCNMA